MSGLLKLLNLLALSVLALLTGCPNPVAIGMYGPAPVEHDPSVDLSDFSYQPAGPIRPGDTLTFTASLNKPIQPGDGWIIATIGSEAAPLAGCTSSSVTVWLNDQGFEGDQTPYDGIWSSELIWLPEYGPQQDLPVAAHLQWAGGHIAGPVFAPPLTVLPAVE